ncbi:ligase-associated DNA damage response DEXH box helicase [Enhydrobacter sp.]|jgi:ATP-dependent Lhr-like helicase|uniref:ligase-associated DNA damage response DEXH box helicase n=1 Tax=Enhydrobacter sp. TaxID=1894999 RepID=UPI002604EC96|nr:ligase-associated DNA damage response DEXH box helicase [Enhydrobacter sp.]WIM09867.1 MAG: ATP-dependent, 3'-5' DNA helicase [Enhydrobacter sp.]
MELPGLFARWFESRGWAPRRHQLALVDLAARRKSALLIAPTGGGKTLAGFLPSLIELTERRHAGKDLAHAKGKGELHTLYISPLKALANDIRRNLEAPIAEMQLPVRAESRTGDTPQSRRLRQRERPPDLLLTTPESLALLLSYPDAEKFFASLSAVIIDELHSFATSKRGHHLALCLARLAALAPQARFVGLSATVADPPELADYLCLREGEGVEIVQGEPGASPQVTIIDAHERLPWGGHMGQHAVPEVYNIIRQHKTSIVFVNTRAQAELTFDRLWRINEDNLAIGLHHGSLAVEQRRKVEAAMAAGKLRAVVATSSLDLGIDWGDVDLVIQMGAPKGVSRLMQRIGRANHRLDEPSRAMIAPANRFEVLESLAALEAIEARELDGDPPRPACLDVLAQHIVGTACAQPIDRDAFFDEVRRAQPYRDLPRKDFDDTFDFVATGGYALAAYERWHRLRQLPDGRWMLASPMVARQFRMNVGTIVELPLLKVKLRRGPMLGEVEEAFIQGLVPGDTFVFAGRLLRFEGVKELVALCSLATTGEPKVPAYGGGRLPLSTFLADRVRGILQDPARHPKLPAEVREWLNLQRWRSTLPDSRNLLIEGFPRGSRQFIVAYCFEGRNAHQTLGMLLTRRMERIGLKPLGFVATDYVLGLWGLRPPTKAQLDQLFDEDMLGDDLEAWMDESTMLRRSFRNVAVIAGLIERRFPGEEKSRRQVTFSSDLIYDALRKHEPDHILLRATRQDAAWQLADLKRLGGLLKRAKGRIEYRRLDRISPLAVPVLLEIGKERVLDGAAEDELLDLAAQELIDEATRLA